MRVLMFTDCKSLFDNLRKDGSVPDDRWTAIAIAGLRCAVSAGPGRRQDKAECLWVPSRWQLADGLTKRGLDKVVRARMLSGTTRLHEESLQAIQRARQTSHKMACVHMSYCCDTRSQPSSSKSGAMAGSSRNVGGSASSSGAGAVLPAATSSPWPGICLLCSETAEECQCFVGPRA